MRLFAVQSWAFEWEPAMSTGRSRSRGTRGQRAGTFVPVRRRGEKLGGRLVDGRRARLAQGVAALL